MPENVAISDIVLSGLVLFGILQLAWFSVMLLRRGAPAETIQQALPPIFSIWVLMWPVYIDTRWLWAGLIALLIFSLAAISLKRPFFHHLRIAWSPVVEDTGIAVSQRPLLMPLTHTITALLIASLWFQAIPEFGFGLALCFCIAFPAAYWVDQLATRRFNHRTLGFPAHPDQTLAGHITLIALSTALLCWALHVYHGTAWQALLIATLIAAMTASATRALFPGRWNGPVAMLTTGFVMWLL